MTFETRNKARIIQSRTCHSAIFLLLSFGIFTCTSLIMPAVKSVMPKQGALRTLSLAAVLIVSVALAFCASAIRYGLIYCLYREAGGESVKLRRLFFFIRPKRFFRLAAYSMFSFLIKALSLSICMLPAVCLACAVYVVLTKGSTRENFFLLLCALTLMTFVSIFFYLKAKRLFFLADYFFVDGSESIRGCFERSAQIMSGKTRSLFTLRFSFALWFALCIFILPAFFVFGYYSRAMAVYADGIIRQSRYEAEAS